MQTGQQSPLEAVARVVAATEKLFNLAPGEIASGYRKPPRPDARAVAIRYLLEDEGINYADLLTAFHLAKPSAVYIARKRARRTPRLQKAYEQLCAVFGRKPSPEPLEIPRPRAVAKKTSPPERTGLPPRPATDAGFGNLWG